MKIRLNEVPEEGQNYDYNRNTAELNEVLKDLIQNNDYNVHLFIKPLNTKDFTITGNRRDVVIVRQYPHGTEIHSLDLTSIEALKSPYYYIQPNDFIYIKPLKQKSWGTGTTGIQSFTTILGAVTLILTTFLLFKK